MPWASYMVLKTDVWITKIKYCLGKVKPELSDMVIGHNDCERSENCSNHIFKGHLNHFLAAHFQMSIMLSCL